MATDIIARGMITEYIAGTNINFTENRDGTVEISASGSISSEDSVARDAIGNHKSDTSNPHNVTPAQIGLGNVDNTSDLDKPISTAVQKAIDNKADKTVATTSADGLMSAEDKSKLDAFEITTTGGKLHDKDIATTDLIPTSLPANGGNADTVDNKHYTDFAQNAVLSTIEQVNDSNLESGIYSVENVSMSFSSDVTSNWFMLIVNKHRTSAGYGTQIAIPYDNGEQRGTFYRVCRAGNWGNWIRIADENIITNENLLLNPDFRINQQGKSEYTGTTECWDKWTVNAGWGTVRSDDDSGALFTCVTPQVNSWVVNQNIPNYKDYRGKAVTFSAQIVTASTKFSLMINDGVGQLAIPVTTGRFSVTYTVSDNATQLQCVICTDGQESENEQIGVFSTKLELGTIATTFVPPNPSIELAKVRAVNDDFVNANDRDQIQIPNNADVPAWIYANGKRYKIYMTNGANTGMTNIPNNTTDYVWYWFDGINIFAREWAAGKYYICDVINGSFSGWKNIAEPIKYRDITLSFNSQMSLIVPQDDMPYRFTSIDDAEHIISVIVTKCHITSPDNSIIYPYASGKNVGIKSNYANLSGTVILRASYI